MIDQGELLIVFACGGICALIVFAGLMLVITEHIQREDDKMLEAIKEGLEG